MDTPLVNLTIPTMPMHPNSTLNVVHLTSNQSAVASKPRNEGRVLFVGGLSRSVCSPQTLGSAKWFGKFGGVDVIHCDPARRCASLVFMHELCALKVQSALRLAHHAGHNCLLHGFGAFCNYFLNGMRCKHKHCRYLHHFPDIRSHANRTRPRSQSPSVDDVASHKLKLSMLDSATETDTTELN